MFNCTLCKKGTEPREIYYNSIEMNDVDNWGINVHGMFASITKRRVKWTVPKNGDRIDEEEKK